MRIGSVDRTRPRSTTERLIQVISKVKYFMTSTSTIGTAGQLRATRALLKFCSDHKHTAFFVGKLEECLAAIEERNQEAVSEILALFKGAGMGSYLDWYPDVICEHEEQEYVETVWWSLTANWQKSLSTIK